MASPPIVGSEVLARGRPGFVLVYDPSDPFLAYKVAFDDDTYDWFKQDDVRCLETEIPPNPEEPEVKLDDSLPKKPEASSPETEVAIPKEPEVSSPEPEVSIPKKTEVSSPEPEVSSQRKAEVSSQSASRDETITPPRKNVRRDKVEEDDHVELFTPRAMAEWLGCCSSREKEEGHNELPKMAKVVEYHDDAAGKNDDIVKPNKKRLVEHHSHHRNGHASSSEEVGGDEALLHDQVKEVRRSFKTKEKEVQRLHTEMQWDIFCKHKRQAEQGDCLSFTYCLWFRLRIYLHNNGCEPPC
jgi:hypothetical protein